MYLSYELQIHTYIITHNNVKFKLFNCIRARYKLSIVKSTSLKNY